MTAPRLERRNYGRNHGYKIDGEKVPGVTTALNAINKPALKVWAARVVAAKAVNEWDQLAELPVAARLKALEGAPFETLKKAALRGNEIHRLGEKVAHGLVVDVPDEHRGPVEAYARWLDDWQIEPIATETPLGSLQHGYGGTADLWARVGARGGALALLDVKTGSNVYGETALQLAAYRYADVIQPEKGVEIPTPEVERVYVAHVLPDSVRCLPVEAGPAEFRTFLYALQVHRQLERWKEFPPIGDAVRHDTDEDELL